MAVGVAVVDGTGLPVPGVVVQHGHGLDTADGAGAGHQEGPDLGQLGWSHHGVAQHHGVAGPRASHPSHPAITTQSDIRRCSNIASVLPGTI